MYESKFSLVSEVISAAAKTLTGSSRIKDSILLHETCNTVAVSSDDIETRPKVRRDKNQKQNCSQ